MHRIDCEKYPCHFPEQDCTLCFCPFYPCNEKKTNGCMAEGGVWSCQNCLVVHRPEVAEMVLDALMKDERLSEAWKKLEKIL
jgi:threonine-phosphate decarboxylase